MSRDDDSRLQAEGEVEAGSGRPGAKGMLALAGVVAAFFGLIWKLGKRIVDLPRSAHRTGTTALVKTAPAPLAPVGCAECAEKAKDGGRPGHNLEVDPVTHEQVGTFFVGCAFLLSAAGGIGFLVVYWTGGSSGMMGAALSAFLGGLGIMLVLWSHLLTLKNEVVAPREQLTPPAEVQQAAAHDFEKGEDQIHRRSLLKWMLGGTAAMFGAVVVSFFRSLGPSPDPSLYSTVWKPGQRLMTKEGKPISVHDLEPGSTVIVFPEDSLGSERSQTVLIRVREDLLQLPEDRRDWAPMGNLAFSRVCTHAGCAVGMYETTTHLLMCPCHQSTFDVLRAAEPTGGPAARPLPQLPLYADGNGILHAGGGFTAPPGPGFWEMPS